MLKMFSVYDAKVDGFTQPICLHSFGECERWFTEQVANPENKWNKFPQDFSIHCIGEYDHKSGTLHPIHPPQLVCSAVSVHTSSN